MMSKSKHSNARNSLSLKFYNTVKSITYIRPLKINSVVLRHARISLKGAHQPVYKGKITLKTCLINIEGQPKIKSRLPCLRADKNCARQY